MDKDTKSRGWKKFVAPKRDYKGWIGLVIGACAVWIAYQSYLFQKNQADETSDQDTPSTISSGNASNSLNQDSQKETNNQDVNQSSSGVSKSDNDSKDPVETVNKIYDEYKSLDIEKDWLKSKKNKDK